MRRLINAENKWRNDTAASKVVLCAELMLEKYGEQ